jgi:competence protein ComEA
MAHRFFVLIIGIMMSFQLFAVDLNTANIEELSGLKGIGQGTAEKIVEYRTKQKFGSIEELIQVKGIGQKKFDAIKKDLSI